MRSVLPFGAVLILAAYSTAIGEDRPFSMTWACKNPFQFQAEVNRGNFEGYVFIKGSGGQCNKTLPAKPGDSRTLIFSYNECGIENRGSIIVVLKSHPELATFRSASYNHECSRRVFIIFEGIEDGTPEQTFPPPILSYRTVFHSGNHTGLITVKIEPTPLYGGFISDCWIKYYGQYSVVSSLNIDGEGCPHTIGGVYMRVTRVTDTNTEILKGYYGYGLHDQLRNVDLECNIKTCLGRCEDPCRNAHVFPVKGNITKLRDVMLDISSNWKDV